MDERLEIYKIAVEMADRVSARRLASNAFFVTVNTGLAGLLAFIYTVSTAENRFVLWIASLMGILLSATWYFAIASYRRLNRSKFEVILELESSLAFPYFKQEWNSLKNLAAKENETKSVQRRWIEWKDRYTDLSSIEAFVPIAYGFVYLALILLSLIGVGLK